MRFATRDRRWARRWLAVAGGAAAFGSVSCTLEEITLVESEDVVVAEVYVQLFPDDPSSTSATAWLHRTLDSGAASSRPVPGAQVLISNGGFSVELAETNPDRCAVDTPVDGTGTCYATDPAFSARFSPGDAVTVEIELPGGGSLEGASTVPGAFAMVGPAATGECWVAPATPAELRWTRSEGAWAYVDETLIHGLRSALASRGIEVETDPLYLLGLSVSAADTSIVFPGEFGVFDRFELDQGLALALQEGLPADTWADVTITATDRNYVNWVRGGNFNPSGLVRVPSLRGDGTGVFATTLSRGFRVQVTGDHTPAGAGMCAGG